jgi:hypothetical protein
MEGASSASPVERVLAELELIPRGDFSQNVFRALYEQRRLHVLGRHATERLSAREVVEHAAAGVRQWDQSFEPRYAPELLKM